LLHFLEQVQINEGTFFQGAWHCSFLFLAIRYRRSSLVAVTNDHVAGALVLARLVTLGGHTPGSHGVTSTGGTTLTTTLWVIDRVHGHTANGGTHTAPALGTSLAQGTQVMLTVGDLADGGAAVRWQLAHLAGAQAHRGVLTFTGHQLHRSASATCQLRTLAGLHLNAVNDATHGDIAQRQGVADLDGSGLTGLQLIASLEALGRDHIATLAVLVTHQCDVGGAIGVVLDPLDLADNTVLVALEIDDAIVLLVAATDVASGDATGVVATAGLALLLQQGGVGSTLVQIRVDDADDETTTRRCWLSLDYRHLTNPLFS